MRKNLLKLRPACMLMVLLLSFQWLSAQTGTVKGTVKDANGNPLAGASVTVPGKKTGTTTDANGNYSLKLPPGKYEILVSFVGQSPQSMHVTVTDGGTTEQNFATTEMADLSSVVVIGSRTRDARSKISTPVPVDVISTKDIKPFAQADLSQMLTYTAPSFQSARQTISDGTDHIDPAGLRGLGPDQTLVLLNGKRRHNTALVNINGSVGRGSVGTDLNAIPVAAIDRIEVLRDGAAAQYGSDAIAGVINIVLKKNYNGFNISATAGQNFTSMPYNGGTKINDGLNKQIDFSGGFAKKNGSYLNVSGQWLARDATNRSGNDNIPLLYLGNGGAFPATQPGVANTVDYRRWLIDQDAVIAKQRGYDRHNIVAGNSSSENFSGFLNTGAPLSKNLDVYLTAGLGQRKGEASGFSRNPNSMNQQPVIANGQRYYYDGFLPVIAPTIKDYSVLAGITGKWGNWTADLSNTSGQNTIQYTIKNTGNASLPANDNPQTEFNAGKLTFFQNITNLDISRKFDLQNRDYFNVAFGGEYRFERYKIDSGELNSYVNGGRVYSIDPIPPYPGTVNYNPITNTAVAGSGSQVFPGFQTRDALNATRKVYAGYADLELSVGKLLLGLAGRYEAYAEKDKTYSNLSGKLTARYEITPALSIRGSVSNGFRAPSLHQRYFQNTSTQFVGGLPQNTFTINNYNPIVRNAFGVQDLKPEKSTSATVGVAGKIGRSVTYTVDAYYIYIKDRIVLSSAFSRTNPLLTTAVFNNPAYGIDPSVSSVTFWSNAVNTETKGIDAVITDRFRMGSANATISLSANFNKNSVVGGIKTNSIIDKPENNPYLNGDANSNPANDLKTALFDRQQRGRIESAQPASKINATFTYTLKNLSIMARAVRWGKSEFLNTTDPYSTKTDKTYWNDVGFGTDQVFNAKVTTDLVFTYRFCPGISLSAGGNNIFDVYPDRVFIDARNDPQAVYANPVTSAVNKTTGGYVAGRDNSNRGRFLFGANQFGYNGRYLYTRLNIEFGQLKACKAPAKPKVVPPPPPAMIEKPKDSDGDGVLDAEDACPAVAGLAMFKGCPDTDGDGVPDKEDACPSVAGPKIFSGCPDTDGDGITDLLDKCPTVAGTEKYRGCPMPDMDKDGVADDEDKCPAVAGPASNAGCPVIREEIIKKVTVAASNILFATGKTTLLKQSFNSLSGVVDVLNQYPELKLDIDGHTDNTGKADKNLVLSQGRADAVKAYFTGKGIAESRITAVGHGQEMPLADNKTAKGKAKNRRVELKVKY
ncbi:MAG: TonB-dependent receptor [Chitinophagaceae bacterium]